MLHTEPPMSTMGEAFYSLHAGYPHECRQDLTPYSAVSSFNLPQTCDTSLITPVSLSQPLSLDTSTVASHNIEIKSSPSDSVSPHYLMFNIKDEFGDSKYNPPMRYKNQISTTDASFPPSPLVPSTPYWGACGVSGPPISPTSDSSPNMNSSPIGSTLNAAGDLSNDGRHHQPQPRQIYRHRASVPLLIAPRVPSPSSRQAIIPQFDSLYRLSSLHSIAKNGGSTSSSQTSYPESRSSMPVRRRRKSPTHSHDGDYRLSNDMTYEERVLMQLTDVDRLPWKEVMVRFREMTRKNMKVPALQMRKKRLVERLRVWTPSDERALTLAVEDQNKLKWDQIAQAMLKYGCVEKWSKEMVQKKWHELHPGIEALPDAYERDAKHQVQICGDFGMENWSDALASTTHSLYGSDSGQMSAISTATMDEIRSQ